MDKVLIISNTFTVKECLKSFFSQEYKVRNIIEKYDLSELNLDELKEIDLLIIDTKDNLYRDILKFVDYQYKNGLNIKIVVLDLYMDEKFFIEALNANINGNLLDIDNKEELVYKIDKVLESGKYYDTDLISVVLKERYMYNKRLISKKEKEILQLIKDGKTNKNIAMALKVSEHTVKRHISNILDKLGLKNKKDIIVHLKENKVTI